MATYTNLTSLQGLKIGDVVNYTSTTAFDAKGYKFRVQLYGKKKTANGGYTKFVIDTTNLPEKILSFNSRGDLIYGNTTDLYYRIAVAGDAGTDGRTVNASANSGGAGGGNIGGTGKGGNYPGASGGTQTSGGSPIGAGKKGSFGAGGAGGNSCGPGGYGWYGGGGGGYYSSYTGAGGGSGFIIGVSTTKYPAGYLGDDTDLRNTLTQSISEGSLTQGGSTSYTAKMVITIVSTPVSVSTQSVLNYYNGNEFINTNAKYYNGTQFIDCDVLYYNGTEFIKI